MTTASPKGRTLPSIVTIHRCAIFEEHTGENWDGEKFPVIIADANPPPLATVAEPTTPNLSTTVATSILKFTWNVVSGIFGIAEAHAGELPLALRAPAPGGGLFQSCQLPPLSGNRSASPRRDEGHNDSNTPVIVSPDALKPRDDAAASRWNRRYADREVVLVAPVMSFPAQSERVLSLNDFTMSNRGGPAITVECTINNMWEDILIFPEGSVASIVVDGKRVDVKGVSPLSFPAVSELILCTSPKSCTPYARAAQGPFPWAWTASSWLNTRSPSLPSRRRVTVHPHSVAPTSCTCTRMMIHWNCLPNTSLPPFPTRTHSPFPGSFSAMWFRGRGRSRASSAQPSGGQSTASTRRWVSETGSFCPVSPLTQRSCSTSNGSLADATQG